MTKKLQKHTTPYQRRIARGLAKGLSRAEARGHGNPRKAHAEQRFLEKGIKLIKSGLGLTAAAKHLHVAPERLRNYLEISGIAKKKGNRWRIGPDDRARQMLVFSNGRELKARVEPESASRIGSYPCQPWSHSTESNFQENLCHARSWPSTAPAGNEYSPMDFGEHQGGKNQNYREYLRDKS